MKKGEQKEQTEDKKRRLIIILFIIFIIIISLILGTYAWFSNAQRKINNFTLGDIKHEILYNFKEQGAAKDILPGEIVNKDVWIHNKGKSDALLRVKITPIWKEKDGSGTEVKNNDVILNFVSDVDTNWQKGNDGYYYYKKVLSAHEGSQAHAENNKIDNSKIPVCYSNQLLDSIQLNTNINDQISYANKNFDVMIVSETLQVNMEACKENWDITKDATIEAMIENLVNTRLLNNYFHQFI